MLTPLKLNIYALEGWVKRHCPGGHKIEPLLQISLGVEIKKKTENKKNSLKKRKIID